MKSSQISSSTSSKNRRHRRILPEVFQLDRRRTKSNYSRYKQKAHETQGRRKANNLNNAPGVKSEETSKKEATHCQGNTFNSWTPPHPTTETHGPNNLGKKKNHWPLTVIIHGKYSKRNRLQNTHERALPLTCAHRRTINVCQGKPSKGKRTLSSCCTWSDNCQRCWWNWTKFIWPEKGENIKTTCC